MDSRKRILIIEDSESLKYVYSSLLSKHYELRLCSDAIAGYNCLRNGYIPDLIILDLSLPVMNGVDFLQQIRASGFYRNIPVIVVSGKEEETIVDQCETLGIQQFMEKPFDHHDLLKNITLAIQPQPQTIKWK